MGHPLDGVREKLKRADESIRNLDLEVSAFLEERSQSSFTEDEQKAIDQWVDFHAKRGIPPRFSVLAGEVVHHLRSSLDHIAWLLSSDIYRCTHGTAIAFPILTVRPATRQELTSYDRKVQGITSTSALKLIERVQPYNARNPADDPLAVVHEFDRIDKHHNIVLVIGTFNMKIAIPFPKALVISASQMDQETFADHFASNVELKISRQVAFAKFGEREKQPLIPALTQLLNFTSNVVESFAGEFV